MRKIIHVDMDYFYAQVEERDNPNLKGIPVAIGGEYGGRGVLSTSNYEARKYGVRSAMPTAMALKLCPHLTLVKGNYKKYKIVSEQIFNVFRSFTDQIQRLSLDEAYLDVTDCDQFENNAVEIAKEIRRKILEETGLTASAGVSYNKLLAKIGSDLHKPDGLAILRPENIENNIAHFPIEKIWGVGKVSAQKMRSLGISTFGDLQNYTKLDLINLFGDFGATLFNYCRGIDHRSVSASSERKSLSVEHTFSEDYDDIEVLLIKLETCYEEMIERLRRHPDRLIKNQIVKIKYYDFTATTIEASESMDFDLYKKLFLTRMKQSKKPVRLLGTGVKFYPTHKEGQLELPLKYKDETDKV